MLGLLNRRQFVIILKERIMAKFLVYLEVAEEGGYIVSCPQLPGCVTQGETVEEALAMIKDAIQGYIASLQKHGEPVPPSLEEKIEKAEVINVLPECQPSSQRKSSLSWRRLVTT
jgi:antitoxin HicB